MNIHLKKTPCFPVGFMHVWGAIVTLDCLFFVLPSVRSGVARWFIGVVFFFRALNDVRVIICITARM